MNRSLGKEGEDKAVEFLRSKRFKILERNYRTPFGEIDIIAEKGKKIYFIEVKTRTTLEFGRGVEAVNKKKLAHITNSLKYYLGDEEREYEIGVLDILKLGDKFEINYISDLL